MSGIQPPPTPFGFVEWFRPGEHDRVREAVAGMRASGASYLRTHLSWAEYYAPGGQAWYDWLIPLLGAEFDLLPCVHYTPPSLSRTGLSSGPPVRLKDFADFVDHVLTRYGAHFSHIELWNEPNNLLDWDWRADHDWLLFCEMIGGAAYWAQHRGWRVVLGGPCPADPHWLELMGERGVLGTVSVVGMHGFPGTWDSETSTWLGYATHLADMRAVLARHNPDAEIWITEAGYSTWRHDEAVQVDRFRDLLAAPAERKYWYGWQDIPRHVAVQQGLYFDPRHYHLGVTDAAGRPKLLRRLLEAPESTAFHRPDRPAIGAGLSNGLGAPAITRPVAPIVVLGGAGFIGSNLVDSFLRDGENVLVLDNLSRPGVERNLQWLRERGGTRLTVALADIRDASAVGAAVEGAKAVFHLAAQVAVTSSLTDPLHDFAVNAEGTLTVLEAVRRRSPATPVIFASTNKVYGALADIAMEDVGDRYTPVDAAMRLRGVSEARPLDFCTPYGCSKGCADQYVVDYAHSYGMRTAALRMSCIYGPRQFGTEDQGWVAHFLISAARGEPITVYGDGKQVRDILHVADAVAAYRAVLENIEDVRGRAFNLGGGPANAVSLRMVLQEIGTLLGMDVPLSRQDWRAGDQLYFVADTSRLREAVGWQPRIGWREGLRDLADWVQTDRGARAAILPLKAGTPHSKGVAVPVGIAAKADVVVQA